MTCATIATLDMADFRARGDQRKKFTTTLDESLSSTGFFFLANHGIPEEVIAAALGALPPFFRDLTDAERRQYMQDDVIGYTPMRVETGEGYRTPDEKHYFHVRDGQCPHIKEVPQFAQALSELHRHFRTIALDLMQAIANAIGLSPYHFHRLEGNSLTRAIHYPANDHPVAHESEIVEGGNAVGMCAAPHTDINMLTLLLAREKGLQLMHKGAWMPITIDQPDHLVVNGADMLRHLTGGRYKSGLHRVVCTPGIERYSMPFFLHMRPETSLVPLKHLGPQDLTEYPFKTAGEFLDHRLRQLGVV